MSTIPVEYTKAPKAKPMDETKLGFGDIFTDHMLVMDYGQGQGWHDMRIVPYENFSMDPATVVYHYGQAIFEGMKAYHGKESRVRLFRPRDNFVRMNISGLRMGMPELDPDLCMEGLKKLLDIERGWVPSSEGTSLYIRPTIVATDIGLGVRASSTYRFFIIMSPSGAYYSGGLEPIGIYVEDELVRAVRGGIGYTKAAANYAASLYAGMRATDKGYAQVLWLDGVEKKYIEEVGSMNVMFVFGQRLVTPMLTGSILEGITRGSIMRLAKDMGYPVEEKRIAIQEIFDGAKDGALTEAFGTGTAAVVSPVGSFCWRGELVTVGNGGIGSLTQTFYDTLTGIQRGTIEDPYGWTMEL